MLSEQQIRSGLFTKKKGVIAKARDTRLVKTNKIAYRKLHNGKIVKSVDE